MRRPPRHIPSNPAAPADAPALKGIYELDRFSHASLKTWDAVSKDLDELNDELYFGVEPQRRRFRDDLLGALRATHWPPLELTHWCRIVTYRFGLAPLSCAGSLQYVGGRFNAGIDLDGQPLQAWPALYLAEDFETAFREKYQRGTGELSGGLKATELALEQGASMSGVMIRGRLERVYELADPNALAGVMAILARIPMPPRARQLRRKLGISERELRMIRTPKHMLDALLKHNWRVGPVQFGTPAPSQIFAEMVRAAGFEAVLYQSSKGPGRCLAVFPENLGDDSFVELADPAPPEVKHCRMDTASADDLCGWESVPHQYRAKG